MGPLALLALLTGTLFLGATSNSDTSNDDGTDTPVDPVDPFDTVDPVAPVAPLDPADPPTPEPTAGPGTDGPDFFDLTDQEFETLDTGAGNDTVVSEFQPRVGTLITGTGDDSVDVGGILQSLDLGDGNDFFDGSTFFGTLSGGAGNDTIITDFDAEFATVDGDAGDDLLVASSFVALDGTLNVNGGLGDDTLQINADVVENDPNMAGFVVLEGGDGADRYEVNLRNVDPIEEGGSRSLEFVIGSFEPGQDTLAISLLDGFSLSQVTLQENTFGTAIRTSVLVEMTNDAGGPDESVSFSVGGVGLTPDDLEFADNATPEIVLRGGDEADTLTLGAVNSDSDIVLDGGAGDDAITVTEFFDPDILGGAGNDMILAPNGLGVSSAIDAGEGDDTVNINGSLGFEVTLGQGADVLTVAPEFRDSLLPVTVTDFDATEDQLILQLDEDLDEDFEIEVVRDIAADRTTVRFNFPELEDRFAVEYGLVLHLEGAPDLSVLDILVVAPA